VRGADPRPGIKAQSERMILRETSSKRPIMLSVRHLDPHLVGGEKGGRNYKKKRRKRSFLSWESGMGRVVYNQKENPSQPNFRRKSRKRLSQQ